VPLIYTSTTYALLSALVFLSWAISELMGPVRWSRSKQGKRRDRSSLLLGTASGLAGVIASFFFPFIVPDGNMPQATFFVGIAFVVLGVGWRWYAIFTLGRYFTAAVMIQENQTVVQHGPYKYSRHPSYAGVLLLITGLGCLIGNWVSVLVIVAGLFLPLLYRMGVEEHEMIEAFGEEYKQYMSRTRWRLIPFVF